mgnify:CR=1 FL=1
MAIPAPWAHAVARRGAPPRGGHTEHHQSPRPEPQKEQKQKPFKKEVFYNTKGQDPFVRKPTVTQQRVDDILDKISQQGYQSLTQEEKDILKKAADNETS